MQKKFKIPFLGTRHNASLSRLINFLRVSLSAKKCCALWWSFGSSSDVASTWQLKRESNCEVWFVLTFNEPWSDREGYKGRTEYNEDIPLSTDRSQPKISQKYQFSFLLKLEKVKTRKMFNMHSCKLQAFDLIFKMFFFYFFSFLPNFMKQKFKSQSWREEKERNAHFQW